MVSEKREQLNRFTHLIIEGIGIEGLPCAKCPVREKCEAHMATITDAKMLDDIPTCEETIFHWIMTGNFLEKGEGYKYESGNSYPHP